MSSRLSLITEVSLTNASFGAVSGMVVEIAHGGGGPAAIVAVHPAGRLELASKFSVHTAGGLGLADGLGVGLAAGEGEGDTPGEGDAPGVGVGKIALARS